MTLILMPMASHEEKSHVAPHFDHLDLRNSMVPLKMLSASHDIGTIANGVTLETSYVTPYFDCFQLRN